MLVEYLWIIVSFSIRHFRGYVVHCTYIDSIGCSIAGYFSVNKTNLKVFTLLGFGSLLSLIFINFVYFLKKLFHLVFCTFYIRQFIYNKIAVKNCMYTAIKTQSVPPSASVILNWLFKKIMNDKLSLSFNVMYVHVV